MRHNNIFFKAIAWIITLLFPFQSECQTDFIANYDRNSISVFFISSNISDNNLKRTINRAVSLVKPTQKYFFNPTDTYTINCSSTEADVTKAINDNFLAAKTLGCWRNTETLVSRASYNLNPQQRSQLKASVRGMESVKDERWFKMLLKNNYIVVLSLDNVQDIKKVHRRRELADVGMGILSGSSMSHTKKNFEGYIGKVTYYIFRISMEETDYQEFFRMWDNDALHNSYCYKIQLVAKDKISVNGTRLVGEVSDAALMPLFLTDAVNEALSHAGESYIPLNAKSMVSKEDPVSAHMGTKEGLNPDDLVEAYELVENEQGRISYKRKAAYRAKTVVDNKNITNADAYSTFYNISWGRASEGMVLIPKKDKGIALSAGYYFKPSYGFQLSFSYSMAKLFKSFSLSQFKLFLSLGYNNKLNDENPYFESLGLANTAASQLITAHYSVGIQKDFYVKPVFSISPYVALTIEHSWYKEMDQIRTIIGGYDLPINYGRLIYPQVGLRFPLAFRYNIKIVPEMAYLGKINKISIGAGAYSSDSSHPSYIVKNGRFFGALSLEISF